jgi:CheY-like chemotaxis protein
VHAKRPIERTGVTSAGVSPPTVLVADDEPLVVEIVRGLLERVGCRVLTAGDGAEAVDVFRRDESAIGCVILDISMPHLSGPEAARRIRAIRGDVPIVLSSGSDRHETKPHLEGLANACIQKPFKFEQVWSLLLTLTGRGETPADGPAAEAC